MSIEMVIIEAAVIDATRARSEKGRLVKCGTKWSIGTKTKAGKVMRLKMPNVRSAPRMAVETLDERYYSCQSQILRKVVGLNGPCYRVSVGSSPSSMLQSASPPNWRTCASGMSMSRRKKPPERQPASSAEAKGPVHV